MDPSKHIMKVFRTPGTAGPTTGMPASGLPEDMILDASRRLGSAAVFYAAVFFVASVARSYALRRIWRATEAR